MAQQPKNKKELSAFDKAAAAKFIAGGTISKTSPKEKQSVETKKSSKGTSGSKKVQAIISAVKEKPAMSGTLNEVTITASPITKKETEKPVGLLSVSQFGGGSKTYLKDDIINMLSSVGMKKEAESLKGMRSVGGDMSDILNKLIGKKGIKAVK